jgi:hypothetical protein
MASEDQDILAKISQLAGKSTKRHLFVYRRD